MPGGGRAPRRRARAHHALLWLGLFAAYLATLGLHSFGASQYGGDEPHYLLAAESIVSDGDVDLADEYRSRAYAGWYPYDLDPHGRLTGGRRHEPHGVGFPLLIAPAYALGGPAGVELFLAGLAALAFTLAAALARRLVPEPWATRGVVVCALSPPALAYATAVYPELAAGAALAGAALLVLRVRDRPRMRAAVAAALPLAALPWLGPKYALPAGVLALVLARWLRRRGRSVAGLVALEVLLASVVVYVTVNDRLYGGLTPYAAEIPGETATDASFPGGYLGRSYRLVALWLDRDYGLLRWAPFLALALWAMWLLWRSRRDRVAVAVPERMDVEVAAALLIATAGAQVLVAGFLSPTMFGFWFPGRHLMAVLPLAAPLAAWGLRHAPRAGAALAALTLAGSAWLYLELRIGGGGLVAPTSSAPWGPAERALPLFGTGSAWPSVVVGAVIVGLAALALRERRHWRQTAGATRRAYSG